MRLRRKQRRGDTPAAEVGVPRALPDPPGLRLRAALAHMAASYADPDISLDSVAAKAGLSRWHMCRMLRLSAGMGFGNLLKGFPLKAAVEMLREPNLRVKEVAFAVGYKHVSSFDRDFRSRYHSTPTEFRLRASHNRRTRV
jgi:AraC-like DNA-binding protein